MVARARDCCDVGLVAWQPLMKHDPLSLSLSLSLSHLVVCWGSAMDFRVWFVGDWWFSDVGLLAWWW